MNFFEYNTKCEKTKETLEFSLITIDKVKRNSRRG